MRKLLPFTLATVGMALLYLVWVAATRYLGGRERERPRPAAQTPLSLEPAGTAVRIIQFYAGTGELTRGDRAVVCYGVLNARSVRLEPEVEKLSPSPNRCLSIAPLSTTTYTLVAEGLDGARVSESFTVEVKPPPPSILFLAQSDKEVRRGQPVAICYGVVNATAVRLEPLDWALRPVEKQCVRSFPVRTTTFTLIATGEGGRTDREQLTVKVK